MSLRISLLLVVAASLQNTARTLWDCGGLGGWKGGREEGREGGREKGREEGREGGKEKDGEDKEAERGKQRNNDEVHVHVLSMKEGNYEHS